jgi:hypothetical protein
MSKKDESRTWGMAEMAECIPRKHKVVSSNPSTGKNEKEEEHHCYHPYHVSHTGEINHFCSFFPNPHPHLFRQLIFQHSWPHNTFSFYIPGVSGINLCKAIKSETLPTRKHSTEKFTIMHYQLLLMTSVTITNKCLKI